MKYYVGDDIANGFELAEMSKKMQNFGKKLC